MNKQEKARQMQAARRLYLIAMSEEERFAGSVFSEPVRLAELTALRITAERAYDALLAVVA
jgi:hypothetical protein